MDMDNKQVSLKFRRLLISLCAAAVLIAAVVIGIAFHGNISAPKEEESTQSIPVMEQSENELSEESDSSKALSDGYLGSENELDKDNSATFTGFVPLPELPLKIEDPNEIPELPTQRIAYSYGVASGGIPHQISVDNQKFFDSKGYNALSYDKKATDKRLYLTFDAGYENGVTAGILDTLKEKNVPAAFFCTLHQIKTEPELIARMITEGHIVGNHSVSHPDFTTISRKKMIEEIQGFDNYMRVNFGYSSPFFRFPEGAYNENALHLVQSLGYTTAFWSVSWADWDVNKQQGSKKAFDTISSRLHPGAVILLHSVSTDNAGALADIIDWARKQGYEFKALIDYESAA